MIAALAWERAEEIARKQRVDRRRFLAGLGGLAVTLGAVNLVACEDDNGDEVQPGATFQTPTDAADEEAVYDALDSVRFAPVANFNGGASLTVTTSDLGGTGSGGVLMDTDTITVNVTAVNDAPINTVPAAQTVAAGAVRVFSSAAGTLIATSDVDAGTSLVHVTLTGTGDPLATVRLDPTGATAGVQINGLYALFGVPLGVGPNPVALSVATEFGQSGSGLKPCIAPFINTPVPGIITPEPKYGEWVCVSETAPPAPSTAVSAVVPPVSIAATPG